MIVEGPDGGGKTTLVNHLSEALGIPVADKIVASDAETVLAEKGPWVEQNLDEGLQRTIFDRHCLISEGIYGPWLRSTLTVEFQNWDWYADARQRFLTLHPLVIFCLPGLWTVIDNVKTEANPDVIQDAIAPIYWAYWHLASGWGDSLRWAYDQYGSPAGHAKARGMLIARVDSWLRARGL